MNPMDVIPRLREVQQLVLTAKMTPDPKHWDPAPFLSENVQQQGVAKTALIIINTPICRKDIFTTIWSNASVRYCADGGANRLYDAFPDDPNYYPDLIKGDLDSLRDDVAAYFRERAGTPIIKDGDQYATDLDKCIKSLEELEARIGDAHQLVIYGGLSGRFDQTVHTIHKLYKLRKRRTYSWVVSEESLTCLLDVGSHKLYQPKHLLGPTCGILPIGIDSAQVTTSGLEWNLDDTETSMDTMVSSSNHLIEENVTIVTNKPVVWTAELRKA